MKTQLVKTLNFILILLFPFGVPHAQTTTLDDYILKQMNNNHIPGLEAAIIKNGKIAWANGYGKADIEKDIPFTANTVHAGVASISKTITATALMQLFDQGFFQMDDSINSWLPFHVSNPYFPQSHITFRMLLSNTSSLISDPDASKVLPGTALPLQTFLQNYFAPNGNYAGDTVLFDNAAPGTHWAYSGTGFSLIALLVQRISGIPFDQYCNQNIFQPLCMNHTSWYFSGLDSNAVSHNYQYKNGFADYGFYESPDYPQTQLKTNVIDLGRFLLMNMNNGTLDGIQILKSSTVALMRTVQWTVDPGFFNRSQGLGWDNYTVCGNSWWGHRGRDLGISTIFMFNTTKNTGVILFKNTDGDPLDFYECGKSQPKDIFLKLFEVADSISTDVQQLLTCAYSFNPCQHSTIYWKNNPKQWPLNSVPMKLGTKLFYNQPQLLDLLNLPESGDASIVLAKALIAAKLNVARGSELSPVVLTINAAMNLIESKRLPFDAPVSFTSAPGIQMLSLAATLNSYNSGGLNTTACSGSSLREAGDTEGNEPGVYADIQGMMNQFADAQRKTPSGCQCNVKGYGCLEYTCVWRCANYCSDPCAANPKKCRTAGESITDAETLFGIYPNPVSESATISFSIEKPGKVSFSIFDLNGRLIKTLPDGPVATGTFQMEWRPEGLNSGVYFLQMQTEETTQMKKLIITK